MCESLGLNIWIDIIAFMCTVTSRRVCSMSLVDAVGPLYNHSLRVAEP